MRGRLLLLLLLLLPANASTEQLGDTSHCKQIPSCGASGENGSEV